MDRTKLLFREAVDTEFAFLERDYGFRVVRREPTLVRLEAGQVFVELVHGMNSYEIGMEIGLKELNDKHGFGFNSVLMIEAPEALEGYRCFFANTPDKVREGVKQEADLLKCYGKRALRGDASLFTELKKHADQYWAGFRYRQIRPQAQEAFRRKDYRKAAELYDSIRNGLTPSELKKLEFAQKKSQQSP